MSDLPTIGSLWVDGDLSYVEQACLLSFVDQGHKVVLFHYGPVDNVPDEIELVDAREIYDTRTIIINAQFGTPVPQSDIFRLQMLLKTDYVWADSDMLAIRPLQASPFIFGDQGRGVMCNAMLRLPKTSQSLQDYANHTLDPYPISPWISGEEREILIKEKLAGTLAHASEQSHSVYGPGVLTWFLQEAGELHHASPRSVFYPLPFRQAGQINDIHSSEFAEKYLKDDTVGIHLWGRRIRWWLTRTGVQRYSFLDRRLRRLGVRPKAALLPNDLKRHMGKVQFPAEIPPRSIKLKEIVASSEVPINLEQLQTFVPFLNVAEKALTDIRADDLYNVNLPATAGTKRGYDHYDCDAARVFALARLIRKYAMQHKKLPDLLEPTRFTEKIVVAKMFAEVPTSFSADRLDVKKMIPRAIEKLCTPYPTIWTSMSTRVQTKVNEKASGDYVLKGNFRYDQEHRFSLPLSDADRTGLSGHMRLWETQLSYGFETAEWWRAGIKRRYYIEPDPVVLGAGFTNWKLWIVDGGLALVQPVLIAPEGSEQIYYDRNFNLLPSSAGQGDVVDRFVPPNCYNEMAKVAEAIGACHELARVDLCANDETIYVREVAICGNVTNNRMWDDALDDWLGAQWCRTKLFPSDPSPSNT